MVSAYLQSCVSEHKRTPFKLEVVHSSDAAPGTVKFPQRCGLVQHTLTETIQPPHLAAYFMHSLPATLPSPASTHKQRQNEACAAGPCRSRSGEHVKGRWEKADKSFSVNHCHRGLAGGRNNDRGLS